MTETTGYADVVLPAAIWGEKTGCFTNVDRTVHLSRQAIDPPGEARPDLDIFLDYSRRMDFRDRDGQPLIKWQSPEEAFEAWKACSRGRPCDYSGLTYDKLSGASGIQWPCNDQHPDGAERLYAEGLRPSSRKWRMRQSRPGLTLKKALMSAEGRRPLSLYVGLLHQSELHLAEAFSNVAAHHRESPLFEGPRSGETGLLRDLHDLWLAAAEVHLCYEAVRQAGRALHDKELVALCDRLGLQTDRQLAWLRTRIDQAAPQALTVT